MALASACTLALALLALSAHRGASVPLSPAAWVELTLPLSGLAAAIVWGVWLLRRDTRTRVQVEQAAAKQRRILQSILDNLGDGVAVADETGQLVLFNPAAERILGLGVTDSGPERWSEVYGLFRADGVTPIPAHELPLSRAIAGHESRDVEMFVRNPSRPGGVYISVTATPLRMPGGAVRGGVAVFRDITELRWSRAVLEDSEARFRSMVETTASALIVLAPAGHVTEFNREAERIHGCSRAEALGRSYLELFQRGSGRDALTACVERVLRDGEPQGLEAPVVLAGGRRCTLLWSISRMNDANRAPLGVIVAGQDVTAHREAEDARRGRELAHHLEAAREGERKRVSREMHDELGQQLTGLKLEFSHLARRIGDAAHAEQLERMGQLVDGTIRAVGRLVGELRPRILDDLGLLEAIRWQAAQFESQSGVACRLELPPRELGWNGEQSTALFRIVQESLTNVARHARAARVNVRLQGTEDAIVLQIDDDGQGISQRQLADPRSFGLIGMRERAHVLGGCFEIGPGAEHGTSVRVRLPL